jgi:hypothetical protein
MIISDNESEDSNYNSEDSISSNKSSTSYNKYSIKIKKTKIKDEIIELKEYISSLEERLYNEINQLKSKLSLLNSVKQDIKLIPLKKQVFTEEEIGNDKITKLLINKDINCIIKLIKIIYIPSSEYIIPIKYCITKDNRKLMYYYSDNNDWVVDENNYIINTLCDNVQKIFMRVNNLDYFDSDDDFMKNQDFILKICDNKYKNNILKRIKEEFLYN